MIPLPLFTLLKMERNQFGATSVDESCSCNALFNTLIYILVFPLDFG